MLHFQVGRAVNIGGNREKCNTINKILVETNKYWHQKVLRNLDSPIIYSSM